MDSDKKQTRLKILFAVLLISAIGLAAEYYFIKPYTEAKPGKGRGKSSPVVPSPTPSISASKSPSPSPSPTPSPSNLFSDDFSGTLSKWEIVYTGFGTVAIENGLLSMAPMVSKNSLETHAPLVAVNDSSWNNAWKDYIYTLRMNTVEQLRGNNPNPWEVGWIIFRYQDAQNFYYFVQKTNGIELGRFNNNTQRFMYTADTPKLSLNAWNTYKIAVKGANIKISINGTQVVDYTDTAADTILDGKIGLYNEDAHVHYDDVVVTSN